MSEENGGRTDGGRAPLATPTSPVSSPPTPTPGEVVAEPVAEQGDGGRPVSMRTAMMAMELRASRGFMTDPQSLAQYERSSPGLAKEIWGAFRHDTQAEAEHRRAMERDSMEKQYQLEQRRLAQGDRAQKFAALCFVVGTLLAAFALYLGHPVVAVTTITAVLAALASTFIVGRNAQAKEAVAQIQAEATPPPRPRERAAGQAQQQQQTSAIVPSNGAGGTGDNGGDGRR